MDKIELMKFIRSLWERGLLTDSPEDFDYEAVIFDYMKTKKQEINELYKSVEKHRKESEKELEF